jgi:ABC-type bacteriocin/lantibiotic exporter with double-glycine peptidase domain
MLKNKIDWAKHFKHQDNDSYCGNAVVQMVLDTIGVQEKQQDIARKIFKPWYGTASDLIWGYLSKYFGVVDYLDHMFIDDLTYCLDKNYIVVVHLDEGHYCIVIEYNKKSITIVDPHKEENGIDIIDIEDFKKRWYTTMKFRDKIYAGGWMLWVDPESKKVK